MTEAELELTAAAAALGDWLLAQRETTRKQKKIIQQVQAALRELPAVPAGIGAEYGFHCRTLNGESLLYRAWRVSLSTAGLEVYSVYSPDPPIELRDKMSHELNLWIRPGEGSGHDGRYLREWIDEVKDPAQFRAGAFEFGIHGEYFD